MESIEELRKERDAAALLLQEAQERLTAAEDAARPSAPPAPAAVPRNAREREAARRAKIAAQAEPVKGVGGDGA